MTGASAVPSSGRPGRLSCGEIPFDKLWAGSRPAGKSAGRRNEAITSLVKMSAEPPAPEGRLAGHSKKAQKNPAGYETTPR
jgi:hypothetical protein